jgi:Putative transposase.
MERTVQAIFRAHFEAYAKAHRLPLHQRRAGWAIIHCRTAVLGGHIQGCPEGHVEGVWYNSCKHRACPQCNQIQIERWLEFQQARLLGCAHHHLIFTLPHPLNPLWSFNRGVMTDLLFQAVGDTLRELTGDPKYLGAEPGFVLTLHTWGRSLCFHPHIHCLITAGGWEGAGQWVSPRRKCFLPAPVVMAVFRGKFLAYLRRAEEADELRLPQDLPPVRLKRLLKKLKGLKWNVRVSARYLHGAGVVKYLARYVRGGPLKNSQILKVTDTQVTYRYYDHEAGTSTELTVSCAEFLRRYLAHVPEHRQQVVRSFGLYAHTKTAVLTLARASHDQPPVERPVFLTWQAYYARLTGTPERFTCPQCGAPLVPRAPLPRRVHDPPLPLFASRRLYA